MTSHTRRFPTDCGDRSLRHAGSIVQALVRDIETYDHDVSARDISDLRIACELLRSVSRRWEAEEAAEASRQAELQRQVKLSLIRSLAREAGPFSSDDAPGDVLYDLRAVQGELISDAERITHADVVDYLSTL